MVFFAALLNGADPLRAANFQGLVDRSPFAPAGGPKYPTSAGETPVALEFRGIVTDREGTVYSVFDATANRGYWLQAGRAPDDAPIHLKGFDPESGLLAVESGGRELKLELKTAKTAAGAPVAALLAGGAVPGRGTRGGRAFGRPGGASSAAGTAQAADSRQNQERLRQVAEEVRRRREQRRSGQGGSAAGGERPGGTR